MTLEIGRTYFFKNKLHSDGKVKIIDDIRDGEYYSAHHLIAFPYLGLIIKSNYIMDSRFFSMDGQCYAIEDYNIEMPMTTFDVGKYQTLTPEVTAVITTVSPHESSHYRLIGYTIDDNGIMESSSWTMKGVHHFDDNLNLSGYRK